MRIETITKREDLSQLASRWDELAVCDRRDGFFRTAAWYTAWLNHVRTDAQPFVIVVRNESGEIIGLAPFCQMTYRDLGFRLTALSFGGREVVSGDFLDFVSTPDERSRVLAAVLDFIGSMRSGWDILIAGEVPTGEGTHQAVETFAQQKGLPVRTQEERTCPYIELPSTFDDYLKSVSQKMRYEIRRDTRDLLEKHGAQIEMYTEPQQVSNNIDTLVALHQAHWERVNKPGNMGRPGFAEFLKQVCGDPPAGSSPRLYIATHDGKPAAAHLAFWFGDSALFYQTGWDPDSAVARVSPGMVLVARSIKDAIGNGLRYFDFLRGDETYKTRLTKTSRTTVTVLAARSFLAKEYLRAARLKDSVKRVIAPEPVAAAASRA